MVAGAGAIAHSTHRLDDIARTVGLDPRPKPVTSDDVLIARVGREQDVLLGVVEAIAVRHADLAGGLGRFAQIGQAQVKAVGGSNAAPGTATVDPDPARAVVALSKAYASASKERAQDADRAVSPELARVLSSMSAGLAQCAHAVGAVR